MDRLRRVAVLFALLLAMLSFPSQAQTPAPRFDSSKIAVDLVANGPPQAGEPWLLALHFTPSSPEWHGYWANPGDAGLGMTLDWRLPQGWAPGEALYPVPTRLLIGGLMNHIYEGDYAVLVPIQVPENASVANAPPIELRLDYLACTDRICVPQSARLVLDPAAARADPRFADWRAQIAPRLDSAATFDLAGDRLRIGIPLPASIALGDPHVFVAQTDLGKDRQVDYSGVQAFAREGDRLIVDIPVKEDATSPSADRLASGQPQQIDGILSFGKGQGVQFSATPGEVAVKGMEPVQGVAATPAFGVLLLAALAGGMLLNIMPCVFPILSLKALALAKAGGDEVSARRDALAYTAGVVLACAALGAGLLLLRAGGEQVGWAFQLQEPAVVVALFLLAVAITANFLGIFEVPGMSISGGPPTHRGSFATGLLAAFVATPCTGPFMAAALGAALLLPPMEAMLLFVALGAGLALPFLLVGFIPAVRQSLPRPGGWMAAFRRWMALPMGLTALALFWLLWRFGGFMQLAAAGVAALVLLGILAAVGRRQQQGNPAPPALTGSALALALVAVLLVPKATSDAADKPGTSLLSPTPFSESALTSARARGTPIFVWFTADWCVTCKVNERVAIERETTRAAFDEAGVVSLRGDFTRRSPEIAEFLARQGAAGVPLYLWYEPGGEAEQLPQVLTPDLLPELARRPR